MAKPRVPLKLLPWLEARERLHLSHAHVQMARELGLNPKNLGGLANHRQEPSKLPLPSYIEQLYRRQFKRERPERVLSIEERAVEFAAKKEARSLAKASRRAEASPPATHPTGDDEA